MLLVLLLAHNLWPGCLAVLNHCPTHQLEEVTMLALGPSSTWGCSEGSPHRTSMHSSFQGNLNMVPCAKGPQGSSTIEYNLASILWPLTCTLPPPRALHEAPQKEMPTRINLGVWKGPGTCLNKILATVLLSQERRIWGD